MAQTREERRQHRAARWGWQVARRDDGAGLADVCAVVHALGVGDWRGAVQGMAVQRALGPVGPSVLR